MFIEELRKPIEGLCTAMKLACEKVNAGIDPDNATRAEICMFVLYLIMDEGSFDEEEFSLIEEAAEYVIYRDNWEQMVEIGRADSEEHYLSQPPESIKFLTELDNALYEVGENLNCVNSAMEVYKFIGKVFVNLKGFTDDKRNAKLQKFLQMVDDYQRENSKASVYKSVLDGTEETAKVIPSKKGVPAPKKS